MTREWVERVSTPSPVARHDLHEVTAALRERPGDWLLLESGAPIGYASNLYRRKSPALLPDKRYRYEIKTANNNRAEGTCDIYLRAVKR